MCTIILFVCQVSLIPEGLYLPRPAFFQTAHKAEIHGSYDRQCHSWLREYQALEAPQGLASNWYCEDSQDYTLPPIGAELSLCTDQTEGLLVGWMVQFMINESM